MVYDIVNTGPAVGLFLLLCYCHQFVSQYFTVICSLIVELPQVQYTDIRTVRDTPSQHTVEPLVVVSMILAPPYGMLLMCGDVPII